MPLNLAVQQKQVMAGEADLQRQTRLQQSPAQHGFGTSRPVGDASTNNLATMATEYNSSQPQQGTASGGRARADVDATPSSGQRLSGEYGKFMICCCFFIFVFYYCSFITVH